ncbi:MAG TPA: hypothetical protein VLU25_12705 [Acidobacteriota bacterium]|nr:hypothetical protein [Acidobacteriota bacterium]
MAESRPVAAPGTNPRIGWRQDALAALLLFALVWIVYTRAPLIIVYDSSYALLTSEQVYRHGDLRLEGYFPHLQPAAGRGETWRIEPSDYRLAWIDGHLYAYHPPGSSLLSVAFIPVFHAFGYSPVGADGGHDWAMERDLQGILAALLTSLFALLVFLLAREILPLGWSVFISLAMAFGTTALSAASRGLWSHTWGILLLAAAVLICWKRMDRGWTALEAVLVATLLSWCFLVRPTFALSAGGIALLAALKRVRYWWILPLAGLTWFALFAVYFRTQFGDWLPAYFFASRLQLATFPEALAGNLISPARGLLIFTPGLVCWIYFGAAYRRHLPRRGWMALAGGLVLAHWTLISISSHAGWWGGHSYGPRLMTDVLPWVALLGILSTRAWLDASQPSRLRRLQLAVLLLLWTASAAIHLAGASCRQTQLWNVHPSDVDHHPHRLWDWSDPPFLRPLVGEVEQGHRVQCVKGVEPPCCVIPRFQRPGLCRPEPRVAPPSRLRSPGLTLG